MSILGNKGKNGENGRAALRLDRLTELLSYNSETGGEGPAASLKAEAPAVEAAPPVEPACTNTDHIEKVARDIAGALMGTVAAALGDARRTVEADRPKLEAAVQGVTELSEAQAETSQAVEILRGGIAGLESRLLEIGGRLTSLEAALRLLTGEVRARGALWGRLAASLRTLDFRAEERFQVSEPVSVTVAGEEEEVLAGHAVNVSENGLGLVLEAPAPIGGRVLVDVNGTPFQGVVRYCTPRPGGHAVGLALSEASVPRAAACSGQPRGNQSIASSSRISATRSEVTATSPGITLPPGD